jgi:Rieske Fe-S protein
VAEHEEGQSEAGPEETGEHPLPSSTIWPLGFAVGVAVFLVGLGLTNWVVFGIGAGLAVLFGALWVWDAVREHRPRRAAPVEEVEEEAEHEEEERFPRNKFLELSTLGLGAVIGAAVTVPVAGFVIGPSFTKARNKDEEVDLGPLTNFPEGEWRVVTFRSKEQEGDVSLRTAFVRYNGLANSVPSFTIISNRCAHLGCPTQPGGPTDADKAVEVQTDAGTVRLIPAQPASFVCPCHGGAYDTEGNRTAGPPVRALDRFSYSIVNGDLVLGTRYSVGKVEGTGADAKVVTYTRFDPGQHVDGWEQIFYPVSPHQIYSPNPNQ